MRYKMLSIGIVCFIQSCNQPAPVVRLAVTTDVHGMIFPYDFIRRESTDHSLAHIYNYVAGQRLNKDTLFFLLDNGDFLQGQPPVYYSNFVDTAGPHLSARVMNYMGYDAGTVGNHDIEAGPAVYNKIRNEFDFPWLAANAVFQRTGAPYFEPYVVLREGNRSIAFLGLITPGIPHWLPKNLWPGMEFRDMVETARKWVPAIIEKENPDLMVGLFHSGTDAGYGGNADPYLNENAVLHVARQVPGFDVIFAGHDHQVSVQYVSNTKGDTVVVVDPGSHGRFAGEVTIFFRDNGEKEVVARNVPMNRYAPSAAFIAHFRDDRQMVTEYLEDTISWLSEDISGMDVLFGPSSLTSLIHQIQLELSGAEVSFTAPLSLSAYLPQGPLLVSDMFQLYRFENMLYKMALTGAEIHGFLEYAAGIWFNTMTRPDDHLLLFREDQPGRLANPYYNFSSAAGIEYTVDVSEPPGERVTISRFTDGSTFDPSATYQVAVNSYRGNGGGGHLTEGAGIPAEELPERIQWTSEKDLRLHLMHYIGAKDTLVPEVSENWQCIPEGWTKFAGSVDRSCIEQ